MAVYADADGQRVAAIVAGLCRDADAVPARSVPRERLKLSKGNGDLNVCIEKEVQILPVQVALELVVSVFGPGFFRLVVESNPVRFCLRSRLTDTGCFQRPISRRHVLLDMNGRYAQGTGLVAEAIAQVVLG